MSVSCSGNSSSEGNSGSGHNQDERVGPLEHGSDSEIDHCKVFMESEDVGRTLELTLLNSYEELCIRLANMFGIESSDVLSRVVYRDGNGSSKQIGDEPFGVFAKRAKRLTILMDSSSDNIGA